jgi:hypothetical protein
MIKLFSILFVFLCLNSCADNNDPPQYWRGCAMEICYYNKNHKELELCKYDCQIRSHWLKKVDNKWKEI